jgi:hypothetical protein
MSDPRRLLCRAPHAPALPPPHCTRHIAKNLALSLQPPDVRLELFVAADRGTYAERADCLLAIPDGHPALGTLAFCMAPQNVWYRTSP